ncbi:hypothetical protein ACFYXS_17270 [Streptomyces sp. NPDC002574]|uniref:hypothetical protein n=1 Tax=Streptomyces sp. NPDC002574 TaxID=3364652 RepID=UPI00367A2ECE
MYAPHRVAALVDACLLPVPRTRRPPEWLRRGLELAGAVTIGVPAALSGGPAVTELLRDETGHGAVVISEPLDTAEVVEGWGVPGAAVLAWLSGVDLLQLGPGCDAGVHDAIRTAAARAVADGDLPLSRLEEAAARVARLRRETAPGSFPAPS